MPAILHCQTVRLMGNTIRDVVEQISTSLVRIPTVHDAGYLSVSIQEKSSVSPM